MRDQKEVPSLLFNIGIKNDLQSKFPFRTTSNSSSNVSSSTPANITKGRPFAVITRSRYLPAPARF